MKKVKTEKQKAKSRLPKVDSKLTTKVKSAQSALEAYLKEHKLDPTKDWSKDKKHGAKIKELLRPVKVTRDKIKESAPEEIHHKKKRAAKRATTVYDYPLVDGKEMSPTDKKKYRVKMRAAGKKGDAPAKAIDKKTNSKKKETTKSPETKVASKKAKIKSKKVKKEKDED
jgi:hypothetical protein